RRCLPAPVSVSLCCSSRPIMAANLGWSGPKASSTSTCMTSDKTGSHRGARFYCIQAVSCTNGLIEGLALEQFAYPVAGRMKRFQQVGGQWQGIAADLAGE